MKSQAKVRPITKALITTPNAYIVAITIDAHGKPVVPPQDEQLSVNTGDTITWTCSSSTTGTLKLFFDPFQHVAVVSSPVNPGPLPTSFGPYTVVSSQPPHGQSGKQFHYHISWTANSKTHGTDPIIIVDPMGGPDE